ncbi:sulfatase [Bremerella alba]|uniref:Arylsulfatase n=1 Tax=Bremerella alba TaxID=980252 RepID=A0A7V9A9L7_9BACT|nr:sulfatase [Bremerella alba]MBA2117291.1 Arylsulfatase [Bremerella alba]
MRTLAILLSALAILLVPQTTSAEQRKPNFVFFLVDDLGWTDLGCYGSSFYETPNVDKLAASGLKFTDAYAACQVCSPTRASILTGRYPTRTGVTDFIGAPQPERWNRKTKMLPAPYEMQLAHNETTIAEILKKNGYATFFAGKWHLGSKEYWPEHQGFDVNQGGIDRGGPYGGKRYFSPYGNPRLEDGPDGEHLPDRLARETVKFMTENKDQPFLAYLSFYSVHTPLMSREDLKQKYLQKKETLKHGEIWGKEGQRKARLVQEHAVYAGMVDAMDQAVGKVLDGVDELGLTQDTVVIFMSDNGGLSTSEGHPTSNLPLRAGKGWIYEGGIREPMIVRWPGTTKAGTETSQIVSSVDFFPTMLQIAGIDVPKNLTIDGTSFAPVLKGDEFERGAIFWHYPHYGNQGGSPSSAVRDGDWKLIEFYEDGHLELYNLSDDIGEQNDLTAKKPDLVAKLHAKLKAWRQETGAKMPTHRKGA